MNPKNGEWWHRPDSSSLRYDYLPDLLSVTVHPHEGQRQPLTCVARLLIVVGVTDKATCGWSLGYWSPLTTPSCVREKRNCGSSGSPLSQGLPGGIR